MQPVNIIQGTFYEVQLSNKLLDDDDIAQEQ